MLGPIRADWQTGRRAHYQHRRERSPVGEEILSWEYGSWSFKRYMLDWTGRTNLKTFEISDGK